MKSYSLSFKQFISSHYVYTGLRITVCVLLPAMVLHHFGMLAGMMGIPLGALFIALIDQPGPIHHRNNGMIAGILINFIVVCIAGFSASHHWLIGGVEIILFSFLFSMAGVYGGRADAIGLIALITFLIIYGTQPYSQQSFIYTAFYISAGGAWYALFSIITNTLQPYRPTLQSLGEYLTEIGDYLQERTAFYVQGTDTTTVLNKLIPYQVKIQQQQTALRELMFKTRLFLKEPTHKGRRIMMIFLESTDLLERIMTAQQDYQKLHRDFENTDILLLFKNAIDKLANELIYTGVAVQNDQPVTPSEDLDESITLCRNRFFELRQQQLNSSSVGAFIRLRQVLYGIEDLADRIKRIQEFTHASARPSRQVHKEDIAPFVTTQNFNIRLFISNLSLQSSQFRHALRLTIAMAAGYIISLVFSLGHSYWIMLSIASILKPSFSTSRKRNIERVAGTLAGIAIAFITLYFAQSNTPIFIVMLLAMMIAYTFLRINNLVSTASITLYVVLSFYFLYPAGVGVVLKDRAVDTIAGAVIALTATYFILPSWEHRQIRGFVNDAVKNNREYYESVIALFKSTEPDVMLSYKLARRAAYVSLANLSDAFQRMLNEPKTRQKQSPQYHQLVTTNHMLTSYIASLAYSAEQHRGHYENKDFVAMMQYISRQFDQLIEMLEKPGALFPKKDAFPVNKKLKDLIEQRKHELQTAEDINASVIRKTLSVMKSVNDQLQLVNAAVEEMMKIIGKMDSQ